jgi:hypothetical protein
MSLGLLRGSPAPRIDNAVPSLTYRNALSAFAAMLWASANASAAPLPTRDQNPFLAGFGLPGAQEARLPAQSTWNLDFNWGSTALVQNRATESLVVDAESRELRLSFTHRIAQRWSLELELPYRYTGGGNLDSFIDEWHDVFGLPEGARPTQPRDRLRMQYSRAGETLIELDTTTEGLADASVALAYALRDSESTAVSASLAVKVPSGKNHWLNSSGAVDVSAILAAERRLSERWTLSGQLSTTWLGNGDLLPQLQRELVWGGHASAQFSVTPALELIVQVDGHTRAFDSELEFFDDALVATLGGQIHFSDGWTLSMGVSEDILVEHSPDVVFVIGVRRGRNLNASE